jgi:NTE family protein
VKGSPYDFSHTDELIARAIKSTNEWIDGGGFELPRTHAQLGLHKHRH